MRIASSLTVLIAAFLLLSGSPLRAEDEGAPRTFPATWRGVWKGPSANIRAGKTVQNFPMELHVEPIEGSENWTWRIIYGEGGRRQIRRYELQPVKPDVGHYRIDEKNGILIESFFEYDTLHSRFRVLDSVIEATYARKGNEMTVTLTTFGADSLKDSGGVGNVPKVESYGLRSVQRATLKRKD